MGTFVTFKYCWKVLTLPVLATEVALEATALLELKTLLKIHSVSPYHMVGYFYRLKFHSLAANMICEFIFC